MDANTADVSELSRHLEDSASDAAARKTIKPIATLIKTLLGASLLFLVHTTSQVSGCLVSE